MKIMKKKFQKHRHQTNFVANRDSIARYRRTKFGNNFHFKDRILKDVTSGIVYKFHCGLCNEFYYGECARH